MKSPFQDIVYAALLSDERIECNKGIARVYGLNASVFINELVKHEKYLLLEGMLPNDRFFYHKQNEIEEATTLTSYMQRMALDKVAEAGFVEALFKGQPCKKYYRINHAELWDFMQEQVEISSSEVSSHLKPSSEVSSHLGSQSNSGLKDRIHPDVKKLNDYIITKDEDVSTNTNTHICTKNINGDLTKQKSMVKKKNRFPSVEKIMRHQTPLSELSSVQQARVLLWFGETIRGSAVSQKDWYISQFEKKLKAYTFDDIANALWRCAHNKFCNGQNDRAWRWSLRYIVGRQKPVIEIALERYAVEMSPSDAAMKAQSYIQHLLIKPLPLPHVPQTPSTGIDPETAERNKKIRQQQREAKFGREGATVAS